MENKQQLKSDLIESIINGDSYLSYSSIKAFESSPREFIDYKLEPKEEKESFNFGTAFHMAVLEYDKFKQAYIKVPEDAPKKPTAAQFGAKNPSSDAIPRIKWWEDFYEDNKDKEILSDEDYNTIMQMRDTLLSNSSAKVLLTGEDKSFEVKKTVEVDGINILGYIDIIGEKDFNNAGFTADLKYCADASPKKFKWKIKDYGYDLQSGTYSRLSGIKNHYIIAIDKKCNVSVWKITEAEMDKSITRLDFLLAEFHRCAEEDLWDSSYEFFMPYGYIEY